MNTVNIACPNCQMGQITLQPHMLLSGAMFTCPMCGTGLSLCHEQSAKALHNSLEQLEQLKQQALTKQD